MTIGIYRLVFNGTHKCYIGQSVNIEKRFKQHLCDMRNGLSNTKLLEAYTIHSYPTLEVVMETSIAELDSSEEEAISIFDSVNNGFNIYEHASQAPTYTGDYGYGNTKYSKEQITEAFLLLVEHPELPYSKITHKTGVLETSVSNIATSSQNMWLEKEFPDKYTTLKRLQGSRGKQATIVSDKLSAKAQGIIYPKIKDSTGNSYTIENAYKFAKEHGLAGNHLTEVLNGHRKSHKGWKICQDV